MRIDIPGIRPNVINEDTYQLLKTYLGFRHVLRSNYTHRLNPKLIEQNLNLLPICHRQFIQAMTQFCQFLETISREG